MNPTAIDIRTGSFEDLEAAMKQAADTILAVPFEEDEGKVYHEDLLKASRFIKTYFTPKVEGIPTLYSFTCTPERGGTSRLSAEVDSFVDIFLFEQSYHPIGKYDTYLRTGGRSTGPLQTRIDTVTFKKRG